MNVAVHVSPEVAPAWPAYRGGGRDRRVGATNGPSDEASERLLGEGRAGGTRVGPRARRRRPAHRRLAAVFSEFGSKPSRYPSSAESLLARVLKGGELPRINALVDTYNAVSLRHVIPVGGEDLDELRGDLRLVRTDEGEVVWRDDEGVTCRRWNWRQEPRTRLTESDHARLLRVRPAIGDGSMWPCFVQVGIARIRDRGRPCHEQRLARQSRTHRGRQTSSACCPACSSSHRASASSSG